MPLETSPPAISLSMPSISTHLISIYIIYCNSLLSTSEVEEEAGLKFWDKMKNETPGQKLTINYTGQPCWRS
jgi:hypothetical protein